MPRINLASVSESTGERATLEPGGYVLKVTGVKHTPRDDKLFLEWDVAEGPMAGTFKDSEWPPRDCMSWKPTALGMLKHKLKVLAEDNPNKLHMLVDPTTKEFATVAEFDQDDFDAFVGCTFGAVVRKRLYTYNGQDREAVEVGAFKRAQDIRDGNWKPMAPRDQRETHHDQPFPQAARPAQQQAAMYDSDVPF